MNAIASADKSTNVRLQSAAGAAGAIEAARSLGLALALWAGGIALGELDGVFARLGATVDLALAAFAAAFAVATYALDGSVRAAVDRVPLAGILAVALAGDAALALAGAQGAAALTEGAGALLAFFAAPLALAAHVPAARAIARRFRKAPARSPGASPAAT